MEWWMWPVALFAITFAMGIVAVLAGVGGGVLFVPIVGALFPFHLDFVRAAGLLIALTSALSAAPSLLVAPRGRAPRPPAGGARGGGDPARRRAPEPAARHAARADRLGHLDPRCARRPR